MLLSSDNTLAGIQYRRTVLVGIANLDGEDVHRGARLALARFTIDQRHYTGQPVTGIDRCKILVLFFTVQDTCQVDAETRYLADHFPVAPECKRRRRGGIEWHIGVASCLSLF